MNRDTEELATRDGRSARWDQHRLDRRRELVRAARAAVHEIGPRASMDEIAAHSGTSKSVYYRYFGDRAGLRHAVAERVTAHMERRLLEAAEDGGGGPTALHRMVEVCLTVAAGSANVYAFAVAEEDPTGPGTVLTPFFERVAHVLEEGLLRDLAARGRDLTPGSPLTLWPRAAVGMVRAALEAWLAIPEQARPDPSATARGIAGWLLHGVLDAAAPTPSPLP